MRQQEESRGGGEVTQRFDDANYSDNFFGSESDYSGDDGTLDKLKKDKVRNKD